MPVDRFLPGDRVQYTGGPVFDDIIDDGDIGWVTKVEAGGVFAPRGRGAGSTASRPPA